MKAKANLATIIVLLFVQSLYSQKARPSPNASVSQTFGVTEVTVKYCRPGIKGRDVWNTNIAPYGKVWRTGANEATTITFTKDVKINGETVKAGSYTLFTIPDKAEWTIILNKTTGQWGTQYDSATDLMRFNVKAMVVEFKERLEIDLDNPTDDSVELGIHWEKAKVKFKIEAA
ncbi:MAG: DUF2911 domain-containing protein [Calditrichaeota bacterium]|nr:DUF2911 domain-containing protein [Calditrichota bacterium]